MRHYKITGTAYSWPHSQQDKALAYAAEVSTRGHTPLSYTTPYGWTRIIPVVRLPRKACPYPIQGTTFPIGAHTMPRIPNHPKPPKDTRGPRPEPPPQTLYREFLNSDPSVGIGAVLVERSEIQISDCTSRISLSFHLYEDSQADLDKEYANLCHKLGVLQKALDALRSNIGAHYKYQQSRIAYDDADPRKKLTSITTS